MYLNFLTLSDVKLTDILSYKVTDRVSIIKSVRIKRWLTTQKL